VVVTPLRHNVDMYLGGGINGYTTPTGGQSMPLKRLELGTSRMHARSVTARADLVGYSPSKKLLVAYLSAG
jgi:hypothetical protein